jgi:plastocyanin
MRRSRFSLALAALAVAALGAATAGYVARAGVAKTTVTVTEREFRITPSARTIPRGRVRFLVKNTGRYPHALAIRGAGLNKRTAVIKPGKSGVLVVDLRSGSYALWCPVPGHAARGMKATVHLAGAAAATTTTTSTTTTDTSTETNPIPGY